MRVFSITNEIFLFFFWGKAFPLAGTSPWIRQTDSGLFPAHPFPTGTPRNAPNIAGLYFKVRHVLYMLRPRSMVSYVSAYTDENGTKQVFPVIRCKGLHLQTGNG